MEQPVGRVVQKQNQGHERGHGLDQSGDSMRKGTPLASRVAQGVSGLSSSCAHQATKQVHLLENMLEGFSLRRSHGGGVGQGGLSACVQRKAEEEA